MQPSPAANAKYVVLTGNPNCGKTTVFNALTGLRAKVGNYAGVTVERKEGRLQGMPGDTPVVLLDLPGTYSLSPQSLDEQIARDILFHRLSDIPVPSLVVTVVDASNLERNLYYASQVIELGYPTLVALNMVDVAEENGHQIDVAQLEESLGVPIIPTVASQGDGVAQLREHIVRRLKDATPAPQPKSFARLPLAVNQAADALLPHLDKAAGLPPGARRAEALLRLAATPDQDHRDPPGSPALQAAIERERLELDQLGTDWRSAIIEARYASVSAIHDTVTTETATPGETASDRLDRVLTHRTWGTAIFLGLMALMFQSIFRFARIPMEAIQSLVDHLGQSVSGWLPPGDLNSLIVDGVIAGVGAVVVFLPQILLLFLFIGFLEDTGYMARAAFLMDRIMSKVGLHGKSFIPMLSSFACAIPGIMATRTIESPKDRLVTILIAPLMSCSARLPVYTVLIAACIPDVKVLGVFGLPGLTLMGMYLLGLVFALLMAWLFKSTLLKGDPPLLIMELPPYKRPLVRTVWRHMWDRSKTFLHQAGTIILGVNILLWFLATYPRQADLGREFAAKRETTRQAYASTNSPVPGSALATALNQLDREEAGARLRESAAGHIGRLIEPVLRPLGFDWQIGIGILSSFAAREVFVSTMSIVYNVGTGDENGDTSGLVRTMQGQRRPDGSRLYTPLLGLTLMVFYVFALQCTSTVVIVYRETNTWKWPLFQWLYLGLLAWGLAFLVYQGGRWLGFA